MAKYTIQKTTLDAIAAAIVDQTGDTDTITQNNMAAKIRSIDNDKVTCKTIMSSSLSKELIVGAKLSCGVSVDAKIYKVMKAAYYENTGGTSLTGSIEASPGDWILATVTTRSTTTFPAGWTVLRESTVLNSDGSNQRMAFLCKQASGPESITIQQSSSARIYLNLIAFPDIKGFAYHSGTEVYSNTEVGSIEVPRPNYNAIVWGCTANAWSSGNWACGTLQVYCMAISAPRQANFIDEDASVTKRTFTMPSTSRYIIDCVEILL